MESNKIFTTFDILKPFLLYIIWFFKRVASESDDGGAWSDSQEQIRIPDAPIDRQTLEAQFKLLYHENMKLDKAYKVLQVHTNHESTYFLYKS